MTFENTQQASTTEFESVRGWIFYDGECEFCRNLARRFGSTFTRRGFRFAPFQSHRLRPEVNLPPGAPLSEMRVRMADGRDFRGADAVVFLSRFVWWGKPLSLLARLPGAQFFLRLIYREIAARRSCDGGVCHSPPTIPAGPNP
jgi:predicted DCC family thiol-disulfide oxidoreductase YuxK